MVISVLVAVLVSGAAMAQTGAGAGEKLMSGSGVASGSGVVSGGKLAQESVEKLTRRQKYDRGLAFDTKTPSVPKGLWIAGVNVSYSQHQADDYRILIVNDMNTRGNSLNLSPMVHYVFANNQSIGLRFAYKRNWLAIDDLSLNLTPELSDMLFGEGGIRYSYENQTYMGFVTYRYYVGLGANKRFIVFNEVQAGLGGGQQRELSGTAADGIGYKTGTYQESLNFRLGLAPGATFFVTNVLAIEVQLGLLGYEFKKLTQNGTDLENATRRSSSISSKFDFLSIAFGTTFYL